MTDPLDLLQRLRVAVMTRRLPADVASWLQCGVDDYMTGAGPLDHCLGLKPAQGKNGTATVIRKDQRDDLIRRLVRGLPGGPWEQAGELVKAIAGTHTTSMQAKYLAEAVRLKMDIPTSRRQLYRILNGQRSD